VTDCTRCGAPMIHDQWGHPCHPPTPCVEHVPDPGGECLACHTWFQTGHGLLIHTAGSCSMDNPRPPRDRPGRSYICRVCSVRHSPTCTQPRRWPLAPLEAVTRTTNLAKTLGVDLTLVAAARDLGMTDSQADRWAIRLGHHPGSIWSDWFDAGLTENDRRFIAEGWRPAWEWNEAHRPETEEAAA